MEGMVAFGSIFKDRNILITGHTGFKGSWITLWLHMLGARITGVALEPKTMLDAYFSLRISEISNDCRQDINDYTGLLEIMHNVQPEIVFHLAAQPLVLQSFKDPLYTLNTNILGTANVLEACRHTGSVKAVIIITTDKVYANTDSGNAFVEGDRLGGNDMYSASKAAAEIVTDAFRDSFLSEMNIATATARAGNVIGGGDWAIDRIIPDCVRALMEGNPVEIRNPAAIRPWQHVLEPLGGYLLLAEKMLGNKKDYNEAWNFGPGCESNRTVREVVDEFIRHWGKGEVRMKTEEGKLHEAKLLLLNTDKVRSRLNWHPLLSFEDSVKMTAEWYLAQSGGKEMREFSMNQIRFYERLQGDKFKNK